MRFDGLAFCPTHWRVGWTQGDRWGLAILWIGPIGISVQTIRS
ncbi:hypothetical protein GGD88_003354 [Roseospira goensis]|uniref:Uncharacterized protein n=1 Tax=Roseospira goensis TaxID=391922 RepID=A0A7W6S2K0_9PROT|nr:hypothetical protein [Roseospira goensis]